MGRISGSGMCVIVFTRCSPLGYAPQLLMDTPTALDLVDGIDLTGRTCVITGASAGLGANRRGHRMADIDLDDPNWERREYDKFVAYGASKTANILHMVELDRRLREQGVRAYSGNCRKACAR
jgi:hypothetical protein